MSGGETVSGDAPLPSATRRGGGETISGGGTAISEPSGGDLGPGVVFDTRYTIEREIDRGGMGVVYLARDEVTDECVCLKVVHPERSGDERARERFLREGKTTRALRHENIVAVYDVNSSNGRLYLAMEYIQGRTLRDVMCEDREMSVERAGEIARAILAGLGAAHRAKVVHRDLKPENVMIVPGRDPGAFDLKILDFGIARALGAVGPQLTVVGSTMGTPDYMAPEQMGRADRAGPTADLYALGVMLYEMLVGVVPRGRWELPSLLRTGLPPALDGFFTTALRDHPDHRFGSTDDFEAAWLAATGAAPAPAPASASSSGSRLEELLIDGRYEAALHAFGNLADPTARDLSVGCLARMALQPLRRLRNEDAARICTRLDSLARTDHAALAHLLLTVLRVEYYQRLRRRMPPTALDDAAHGGRGELSDRVVLLARVVPEVEAYLDSSAKGTE